MKLKNKITAKAAEKFCAFLNECDNREMFHLISDLEREEIPFEVEIHLGGFHSGWHSDWQGCISANQGPLS